VSAYWLIAEAGTRIPIRPDGIVVGRGARSDLIVDGEDVSRTQAILYAGDDGPCIAVLGTGRTAINGRDVGGAAAGVHALVDGDRVEIATATYVVAGAPAPGGDARSAWMLRDRAGTLVGVTRTPFAIGGGASADVRIEGWPDAALVLHLADRLNVEARVGGVRINDRELAAGELEIAPIRAVIAYRDHAFAVVAGGPAHDAATVPRRGLPDRVTLAFLPRGGRLTISWGDRDVCVYLPERRCELMAVLLQTPGELVSDEVLIARLWPGQARSRVDLNVVIHRARTDLARAGLDGATLIERAAGGSATRVATGERTRVAIV
jgi:hypothetical protein